MRLLVIARPFVLHGGVERATAGLVEALVEHGFDVHLLSPGNQQAMRGVTLHRLRLPPLPAAAHVLALAASAKRAAARGGWDVVQSHERTLGQHLYRAGEGCHRAYLASVGAAARRRSLYHRIVLALERRIFATTPRIVAIARRGAAEIGALYGVGPARLSVVYNGVDLERFHPRNRALHRASARADVGIAADAFTMLFVGSGFERKGLGVLIDALGILPDARCRLVVIGKGDRRTFEAQAARAGVADRIVWLGVRADVERWYAAADVVALPSRYEPFGNVHLEALASGLPVIASAAAGGAEVVEEGRTGTVIDPSDPEAIATAIARLRDARHPELSAAARQAAEPFTFAAQVAGFADQYRRLKTGIVYFS